MRKTVIVSEEELLDAISDRFWDEMFPILGEGNPLWGPLAIALAASVKAGVRKGEAFVAEKADPA